MLSIFYILEIKNKVQVELQFVIFFKFSLGNLQDVTKPSTVVLSAFHFLTILESCMNGCVQLKHKFAFITRKQSFRDATFSPVLFPPYQIETNPKCDSQTKKKISQSPLFCGIPVQICGGPLCADAAPAVDDITDK